METRSKRRPLADITNILDTAKHSSQSQPSSTTGHSSNTKPTNPPLPTTFRQLHKTSRATVPKTSKVDVSICSESKEKGASPIAKPTNPPLPTTFASTSYDPHNSPPRIDIDAQHPIPVGEPSYVYNKQLVSSKKKKRKEIDEVQVARNKRNRDGVTHSPKFWTARQKKPRRAMRVDSSSLPRDFVEKQNAYFAEIDAFELPEEEVNSIYELD